MSYLYQLM